MDSYPLIMWSVNNPRSKVKGQEVLINFVHGFRSGSAASIVNRCALYLKTPITFLIILAEMPIVLW